jgi:hypothetical protein
MDKKVGNRISVTEENPDVAYLIRGWEINRHLHKRLLSTRLPIRDFLSHLIYLLKESEKSDQFYERMSQVATTGRHLHASEAG